MLRTLRITFHNDFCSTNTSNIATVKGIRTMPLEMECSTLVASMRTLTLAKYPTKTTKVFNHKVQIILLKITKILIRIAETTRTIIPSQLSGNQCSNKLNGFQTNNPNPDMVALPLVTIVSLT